MLGFHFQSEMIGVDGFVSPSVAALLLWLYFVVAMADSFSDELLGLTGFEFYQLLWPRFYQEIYSQY